VAAKEILRGKKPLAREKKFSSPAGIKLTDPVGEKLV
jgi:hypothetical protein